MKKLIGLVGAVFVLLVSVPVLPAESLVGGFAMLRLQLDDGGQL